MEMFRNTVGSRTAELGLQLGTLYSPQIALQIGLIDEMCPLNDVTGAAGLFHLIGLSSFTGFFQKNF